MRKIAGNGNLVPFNQTSGYIHRKAKENHKAGRYLEAVGLFFRSLELKDDPQVYYDLAMLYKDMSCHDLAAKYLYRALALNPALYDGFYELAVNNYFLGRRVHTMEAAALYLKHEPYGIYSYEAQELMEWAVMPDLFQSGRRAERIMAMAVRDDKKKRRDLAAKRFMRAGGLLINSPDKLTDLILYMNGLSGYQREALALSKRAVRRFKKEASVYCALCAVLYKAGRKAQAAAVMKYVLRLKNNQGEEALVFRTACLLGAWAAAGERLLAALEKHPYDIHAMVMLAYLAVRAGDEKRAETLLKRSLAVCPMFHQAREALRLVSTGQGEKMPLPGEHTVLSMLSCMEQMKAFFQSPPNEITVAQRQQLEAAFTLPIGEIGRSIAEMIMVHAPDQAQTLFKMWMVDEELDEGVRHDLARCLSNAVPDKTHLTLVHGRLAYTALKTVTELKAAARHVFIKRFMAEARDIHDANGAAHFAAKHYDRLPPEKKEGASGNDTYAYIAALKIIHLNEKGMDREAERYVRELLISRRRVERALLAFYKTQGGEGIHEAD